MKNIEGKKRNNQHRINDDGIKLLNNVLPNSKSLSVAFNEQVKHDYGIDGEFQIFVEEVHTGEFYKVQLKSTSELKYSTDGKTISLPIDLESLYFLMETSQRPTALIVADITDKRVFWHPIQTDTKLRASLDKRISEMQHAKNPTLTVKIKVANQLSANTFGDLHGYFKNAELRLARKRTMETRTDDTLGEGYQHLKDAESEVFDLEGYDWKYRVPKDPVPMGVIFSVTLSKDRIVDYYPNKNFKQKDAPRVKVVAKFKKNSPEDEKKYQAFEKAIKQGIGQVTLERQNLDSVELNTGSKYLDKLGEKNKYNITIGQSIKKQRKMLLLNNGREDVGLQADIWFDKDHFNLESVRGQPLQLTTSIPISKTRKKVNVDLNFNIDSTSLKSYDEELVILSFMYHLRELTIYALDPLGVKQTLMVGKLNTQKSTIVSRYKFIKALTNIEKMAGIKVNFPLPKSISKKDINNVYWAYKLLKQGLVKQTTTVNMEFHKKPPKDQLQLGNAILVSQNPANLSLFGKEYVLKDHEHKIKGTVDSINKVGELSYKVHIKEAEITLDIKNS